MCYEIIEKIIVILLVVSFLIACVLFLICPFDEY